MAPLEQQIGRSIIRTWYLGFERRSAPQAWHRLIFDRPLRKRIADNGRPEQALGRYWELRWADSADDASVVDESGARAVVTVTPS